MVSHLGVIYISAILEKSYECVQICNQFEDKNF
jgi:hypothetical protein